MTPKSSSKAVPFKVYSGLEEFDLDQQLQKERSVKNREVVLLDGEDADGGRIVYECIAHSYLDEGQGRYVIVDHAEKVKHPEALFGYIKEKDPTDVSVTLVAIIRPKHRQGKSPELRVPDVWVKAGEKGISKTFKHLPPWKEVERHHRVNEEAGRLGVNLGKNVAEGLIQLVGYDLHTIYNELKKLKMVVGSATVSLDHLKKYVSPQPEAVVQDLANAAVEKNLRRAMNLLRHIWIYEGDDAFVTVTGALIRNVERLLVARSMVDAGRNLDDISQQMDLNKFLVQNTYMLWVNRHSVQSLTAHLANLCQLDANVKGPSRSKRTQVELAVLSVAS